MADISKLDQKTKDELAALAMDLAGNKDTRKTFGKLAQKINPNLGASFRDVEMDELREEIDGLKTGKTGSVERKRAEIEARMVEQRAQLGNRYDEASIGEIEKVMQEYGLTDYEAGAKIYAADNGPGLQRDVSDRSGGSWEMPKYDGLFENPIKAARNMAHNVIDEFRRGALGRRA